MNNTAYQAVSKAVFGTQVVSKQSRTITPAEYGFITSVAGHTDYFVRYWKSANSTDLRTKANSERTPAAHLRLFKSHTLGEIEQVCKKYDIADPR